MWCRGHPLPQCICFLRRKKYSPMSLARTFKSPWLPCSVRSALESPFSLSRCDAFQLMRRRECNHGKSFPFFLTLPPCADCQVFFLEDQPQTDPVLLAVQETQPIGEVSFLRSFFPSFFFFGLHIRHQLGGHQEQSPQYQHLALMEGLRCLSIHLTMAMAMTTTM